MVWRSHTRLALIYTFQSSDLCLVTMYNDYYPSDSPLSVMMNQGPPDRSIPRMRTLLTSWPIKTKNKAELALREGQV